MKVSEIKSVGLGISKQADPIDVNNIIDILAKNNIPYSRYRGGEYSFSYLKGKEYLIVVPPTAELTKEESKVVNSANVDESLKTFVVGKGNVGEVDYAEQNNMKILLYANQRFYEFKEKITLDEENYQRTAVLVCKENFENPGTKVYE